MTLRFLIFQLNITFSKSLTQVYEYPSFESMTDEETNKNTTASHNNKPSVGITSNNIVGSFGESTFSTMFV